jgi:hypothetical protein
LLCGRIRLHRLVDADEAFVGTLEEVVALFQPVLVFDLALLEKRDAFIDIGLELCQLFLLQQVALVAGGVGVIGAEGLVLVARGAYGRRRLLLGLGAGNGKDCGRQHRKAAVLKSSFHA